MTTVDLIIRQQVDISIECFLTVGRLLFYYFIFYFIADLGNVTSSVILAETKCHQNGCFGEAFPSKFPHIAMS